MLGKFFMQVCRVVNQCNLLLVSGHSVVMLSIWEDNIALAMNHRYWYFSPTLQALQDGDELHRNTAPLYLPCTSACDTITGYNSGIM